MYIVLKSNTGHKLKMYWEVVYLSWIYRLSVNLLVSAIYNIALLFGKLEIAYATFRWDLFMWNPADWIKLFTPSPACNYKWKMLLFLLARICPNGKHDLWKTGGKQYSKAFCWQFKVMETTTVILQCLFYIHENGFTCEWSESNVNTSCSNMMQSQSHENSTSDQELVMRENRLNAGRWRWTSSV